MLNIPGDAYNEIKHLIEGFGALTEEDIKQMSRERLAAIYLALPTHLQHIAEEILQNTIPEGGQATASGDDYNSDESGE